MASKNDTLTMEKYKALVQECLCMNKNTQRLGSSAGKAGGKELYQDARRVTGSRNRFTQYDPNRPATCDNVQPAPANMAAAFMSCCDKDKDCSKEKAIEEKKEEKDEQKEEKKASKSEKSSKKNSGNESERPPSNATNEDEEPEDEDDEEED